MEFTTDDQTIKDLNIFPKQKEESSLFDYFNECSTWGGKEELRLMFCHPSNDLKLIYARIKVFKYIQENDLRFNFNKERLDLIEFYLKQNTAVLRDHYFDALVARISYKIKPKNEAYIIQRGLAYLSEHLYLLQNFFQDLEPTTLPDFLHLFLQDLKLINAIPKLNSFVNPIDKKMSFRQVHRFDYLIRKTMLKTSQRLISFTYKLDAFISVVQVMKKNKLCLPQIKPDAKPYLKIKSFFHPFLKSPVKNNLEILANKNLCFATGSNMSGKSTFLKTMGLCVYLSHMGFPVPAQEIELSLFNGLFTTINISDDINQGYSHYFSEVKRVKEIAVHLKEKKNVMVIFDELYRGTNVKDAYDATLLVSQGFTKAKRSLFFISSHIIEIGQPLKENARVDFKCLESELIDHQAVYNYRLKEGLSSERLGLSILKNEKVLEIMDSLSEA